jgi:large repetitive protein
MDLKFDRDGTLLGVTTTDKLSATSAILYRIDPATGAATKIVDLVGSTQVMALEFGSNGRLFANDAVSHPGLYLIDIETGFDTAIATLPFGFLSNLVRVGSPR